RLFLPVPASTLSLLEQTRFPSSAPSHITVQRSTESIRRLYLSPARGNHATRPSPSHLTRRTPPPPQTEHPIAYIISFPPSEPEHIHRSPHNHVTSRHVTVAPSTSPSLINLTPNQTTRQPLQNGAPHPPPNRPLRPFRDRPPIHPHHRIRHHHHRLRTQHPVHPRRHANHARHRGRRLRCVPAGRAKPACRSCRRRPQAAVQFAAGLQQRRL
ncbi:hypothetical protein P171DRAFT_517467, partial [Karstenula rhodostoma CBS 690.94]